MPAPWVNAARRRRAGHVTKLPVGKPQARVRIMLVVMAFLFSLLAGRALQVQALDAEANAAEAAKQMTVARDLPAVRGQITDSSGLVLAYTESAVNVIGNPDTIADNGKEHPTAKDLDFAKAAPAKIAAILVKYLGGADADYLPGLTKANTKYVILAKQIQAATYDAMSKELAASKLVGIYRETAPSRTYPNGRVASNIVGWVDGDGKGAGGLEYSLNDSLTGTPGREEYENSPNGKIPLGSQTLTAPVDGKNYQLTIDSELQWMVEQRLAQSVKGSQADWGTAIGLNVKTGEVLFMANYPSFDSNSPGSAKTEDLGNRAVAAAYEPGSVQKTLTFASMFDAGTIDAEQSVVIPPSIKSGDHEIADAEKHGTVTYLARGVFVHSSNIGTIELARQMPKDQLVTYLQNFGLGQKTGLGLPGEATGYLPPTTLPDYTRDSLAFGMALSVTPIQMAAAVATVANGGVYNAPSIIKSVTTADGQDVTPAKAAPRRVISAEASSKTLSLMEQMVLSKGKGLMIDNYNVAGKTGTAKRIDPTCNCYRGLVTSFMAVAPAEDPQILVYVVVSNPAIGGSGYAVAGPVYQDIMRLALPRYGIAPSTTKVTSLPLAP